jgi:hypothetical protein
MSFPERHPIPVPILYPPRSSIFPSKLDRPFHNSSLQSPASSLRPYTRAPPTLSPRKITIDKHSIARYARLGLEHPPRRHARTGTSVRVSRAVSIVYLIMVS